MPETTPTRHSAIARGWAVAGAVAAVGLAAGAVTSVWPLRPSAPAIARPLVRPLAAPPLHAAAPPRAPSFAAVQQIVRVAEASRTARSVGVVVYDLRRDSQGARLPAPLFSLRPDRIFRSASIIKLAIMVAAFQARQDGAITPDRFERLRPYLRRMITVSDNPSATYLIGVVGRARVNDAMASLGLRHIHLPLQPQSGGSLAGSKAAPGDVARLLVQLYRREVVSPAASNEMLLLLGASEFRQRIPAGLPDHPGLWVGNKTGTVNGIAHDCAVVLDPISGLRYTLAIFTEGVASDTVGDHLCMTLSQAVYSAMQGPPAALAAAVHATNAPPGR